MSKDKIVLIGGGGHCKSVIDVIETDGRFAIEGIVDVKEKVGQSVFSYKVIAADDDLQKLSQEFKFFLITIGQIKSSRLRESFFKTLKDLNVVLPVIISPFAIVSKYANIGEGSVIMHKALINAGAGIGNNCIINSESTIEHDAQIGSHCHISTGAIVNGDCTIKDHTFIGSNATISHGITVEENNVIGAGCVVLKDTTKNGLYVGNPGEIKKVVIR